MRIQQKSTKKKEAKKKEGCGKVENIAPFSQLETGSESVSHFPTATTTTTTNHTSKKCQLLVRT
jgi:hypothetical protein